MAAVNEGEVARVYGQSRWIKDGTRRPLWADKPKRIHERGYIPLKLLCPGELGSEISDWCRAAVVEDAPEDPELSALARKFALVLG